MNESNPAPRYLYVAIGLVFALLLLGVYLHYRSYMRARKVRDLQQALRTDLSPQERDEKRRQLRDAMQAMTPRQREQLAADGRKRFEERMTHYAKMSKQEKERFLDDQINRMEQFRRNAPPNSNFSFGNQANRSAEDRERRRRERLDSTTPEFRAAMDQFRRDMAARRQQRGMPPGGANR